MGIADLSTHQNVVSSAFRLFGDRLYEQAGATEVQVSVNSGLQRGVARKLSVTGLRIGAGPDATLMLLDPSVIDDHVVLTLQQSVFGVLVDADVNGHDVHLNGKAVEAGEALNAIRLPLDIRIGDNEVRIARPGRRRAPPKMTALQAHVDRGKSLAEGRDPVILLSVGGLLLLFLFVVAGSVFQWHNTRYDVVVNTATQPLIPITLEARDWVEELEAVTAGFNLQDDLTYTAGQGGMIFASGAVPETKLGGLRDVQAWHDAQSGAPQVIWEIVRQVGLETMPNVALVKLSEPRHIQLESGTIAEVGDVLIQNWEITEIGDLEMILQRGSERTIVAYAELAR